MTSQWKNIWLFIYSEQEFTGEREYLYKYILPQIRQWCKNWRMHLIVVDHTSANKALESCCSEGLLDYRVHLFVARNRGKYACIYSNLPKSEPLLLYLQTNSIESFAYKSRCFSPVLSTFYQTDIYHNFVIPMVEDIKKAISSICSKHMEKSWLLYQQPQITQDIFVEEQQRMFAGRENLLKYMREYVERKSNHSYSMRNVLLVQGKQGCGKSALLAKFYHNICHNRNYLRIKNRYTIIPIFLEPLERQTLSSFLRELCSLLMQVHNLDRDIPAKLYDLIITLHNLINDIKNKTLIIVDGIDKLISEQKVDRFSWLPCSLPKQVKIIVSTSNKKIHQYNSHFHSLTVNHFNKEDICQVFNRIADVYGFCLKTNQQKLLLKKSDIFFPIYWQFVFMELIACPPENLTKTIVNLPENTTALLQHVFIQLQRQYREHRDIAAILFGLICSTCEGLSQQELRELLVGIDPDEVYKHILNQKSHYLARRNGKIVIEQDRIRQAIDNVYNNCTLCHSLFANYLEQQPYIFYNGQINTYKLNNILYHYQHSKQTLRCVGLLCDLEFIGAKLKAGLIDQLCEDYRRAIVLLPYNFRKEILPEVYIDIEVLLLLQNIFEYIIKKINITYIKQNTSSILSMLYNYVYWYDCPEAESHYRVLTDALFPWQKESCQIHYLAQHWRLQNNKIYLQALRPIDILHFPTTTKSFREHDSYMLTFNHDGSKLATVAKNHSISIRNTDNGLVLTNISYKQRIFAMDFSPDNEQVLTVAGEICLWDIHTGALLQTLNDEEASCACFHPHKNLIAIGALHSGAICIREIPSGKLLWSIDCGHGATITNIAFSPSGGYLATSSLDKDIKIWNSCNGREIYHLRGHKSAIDKICFNHEGSLLASASIDRKIKIWNPRTGVCCNTILHHFGPICDLHFGPGSKLITATSDNTVRIWTYDNHLNEIAGHPKTLSHVAIHPGGKQTAAIVAQEKQVTLWSFITEKPDYELQRFRSGVSKIDFNENGSQILCLRKGKKISALDIKTQEWRVSEREEMPENPSCHPYYKIKPCGESTLIIDSREGNVIASLPMSFYLAKISRNNTVAGYSCSYLYLFRLSPLI